LRRAAGRHRERRGLVRADVRAPRAGGDRGHMAAAAARRLVRPRRGVARMTRTIPAFESLAELADACGQVPGHEPWPRIGVHAALWRRLGSQLAQGQWALLVLLGDYGRGL